MARKPKRTPRPGTDDYGRIPMQYAANEGNLAAVQQALASGADVNHQDDAGYTALHFAAQSRRVEVLELLLQHSANVNLVDQHGNGPLWTAVMNNRDDMRIIKMLIKAGATRDQKNVHGRSPMDMATTIASPGLLDAFGLTEK